MEIFTKVDLQKLYNQLSSRDQERFISYNLTDARSLELVEELTRRGYKCTYEL